MEMGVVFCVSKYMSSRRRKSFTPSIPQDKNEIEKNRQESVAMKAKIRSLEVEVNTLRYRLESLRKAKSTTIIRREREEIHIVQPPTPISRQLGVAVEKESTSNGWNILLKRKDIEIHKLQDNLDNLERAFRDRLSEKGKKHLQRITELEESLTTKEKELNDTNSKLSLVQISSVSQHSESEELRDELEMLREENITLKTRLNELTEANVRLQESHLVLQGKCDTLLEDLSIKEARWSEKEDMLHAEIRKQWGERYNQWISKAEKKMEELQQINVMLQTMMKTKSQNPGL